MTRLDLQEVQHVRSVFVELRRLILSIISYGQFQLDPVLLKDTMFPPSSIEVPVCPKKTDS